MYNFGNLTLFLVDTAEALAGHFLKHASIVESAARSFAVISNLRKPEKATKAYSISAAGAQFDVGVEERPFRCQVRCWFFVLVSTRLRSFLLPLSTE